MSKEPEIRVKFEIGDIKFEAEGSADLVERERSIFNTQLLPAAVDAIMRTRPLVSVDSYTDISEQQRETSSNTVDNLPTSKITPSLPAPNDFSRVSLASFVKSKGADSHYDFILCAVYYNEQKNGIKSFTSVSLKELYSEAKRPTPNNMSMSISELVKKGLIMEDSESKGSTPKQYVLTSIGEDEVLKMTPKEKPNKKTTRVRKTKPKEKSMYATLNCDELNLNDYPSVNSVKSFKEKMLLILYIVTNENKGEWFTTLDVQCLVTDIFGEKATISQINGIFNRNKTWFKTEAVEGNSKEVKRKLLNQGIDYAKSINKE